jgi:hypothetical protein
MDNDNHSQKTTITSVAIIAVVAALSLFGVVMATVATTTMQLQEAEARGCNRSVAFDASQGRCFHP